MVKSFCISYYVLLNALLFHSCIQSNRIEGNLPAFEDNKSPVKEVTIDPLSKNERAALIAKSFIGQKELPNNGGFKDKNFERFMINTGWKKGNAWCAFVMKGVLDSAKISNKITGWSPTSYNRNNVIYTDGAFRKDYELGDIFSLTYNKYLGKSGRFKGIGHTGMVTKIEGKRVYTLEGNTNDSLSRDGDGFYQKIRPLNDKIHITRWH